MPDAALPTPAVYQPLTRVALSISEQVETAPVVGALANGLYDIAWTTFHSSSDSDVVLQRFNGEGAIQPGPWSGMTPRPPGPDGLESALALASNGLFHTVLFSSQRGLHLGRYDDASFEDHVFEFFWIGGEQGTTAFAVAVESGALAITWIEDQ